MFTSRVLLPAMLIVIAVAAMPAAAEDRQWVGYQSACSILPESFLSDFAVCMAGPNGAAPGCDDYDADADTDVDLVDLAHWQVLYGSPLPDVGSFFHADNWNGFAVPGPTDVAKFGTGFDVDDQGTNPHHIHFGDACIDQLNCAGPIEILGGDALTQGLEIQSEDWTFDFGTLTHNCDPLGATTGNYTVLGDAVIGDTIDQTGLPGDASLTITGPGTFAVQEEAFIAAPASSVGAVTVTGNGSHWAITNYMMVGVQGAGQLEVLDGGIVSAEWSRIGDWSTSVSEVTVDGVGSAWNHATVMEIGTAGQGTLNIQNGGTVTNGWGIIANAAGSVGAVHVTGGGSNWTRTGALHVGRNGEGTLSISDGGSVSGTWASVGDEPTGIGVATVIGPESTWTNTGDLTIGRKGAGSLLIDDGATVSGSRTRVGEWNDATGEATIQNSSAWHLSGELRIGDGPGCALGFNGGYADAAYDLGLDPQFTGIAHTDGTLTIGLFASGDGWTGGADESWAIENIEVLVCDAADCAAAESVYYNDFDGGEQFGPGVSGGLAGAGGLESVQGYAGYGSPGYEFAGQFWRNDTAPAETTTLTLSGLPAHGYLELRLMVAIIDSWDGDTPTNGPDHFNIELDGDLVFSETFDNFEGPGDQSYVAPDGVLLTECLASGTVHIESGGSVSNTSLRIGNGWSGTGSATITGAGSGWTLTDWLTVGNFGQGTLSILDGATFTKGSGETGVGIEAGASGQLTVSDPGSTYTDGSNMYVGGRFWDGGEGTGTLTVSDQAHASVAGAFIIGEGGHGSVLVESGGQLTTDWSHVGRRADAIGEVTVTGTGSSWQLTSGMSVPMRGQGTLTVAEGGQVSATTGEIAHEEGSVGLVSVNDPNSAWILSGDLDVGIYGNATLNITNGGTVDVAQWASIGWLEPSQGVATVDGAGSSWTLGDRLTVGDNSSGTLIIQNGGTVSGTWSELGNAATAAGVVQVTGAGSTWNLSEWLTVGDSGVGTLEVEAGGFVEMLDGGLAVGTQASSTGVVSVTDPNSSIACVGSTYIGLFGSGTLSVANGGYYSSTLPLSVGSGGGLGEVTITGAGSRFDVLDSGQSTIANGTLTVGNGAEWSGGALYIGESGTLLGDALVTCTNLNNHGTVAPGLSAGTLTIDGDFNDSADGTLAIEFGGTATGEFDQLAVTGNADLAGTIEITLIDGFVPMPGDSFVILTAAAVTGEFTDVVAPDLGGSTVFGVTYTATEVIVVVDGLVGVEVVPATIGMYEGFAESLEAHALLAGGGYTNVTYMASWSSDDPNTASIEAPGLIRGEAAGSTTIRAVYGTFEGTATANVLALPPELSTYRVSVDSTGVEGDAASSEDDMGGVDVSADGRYVTFASDASNLVAGDTNTVTDIFVRDVDTGTTVRISISSAGLEADGECTRPRLSGDGRFVVFQSAATSLVADDTNGQYDVFLHDRDSDENGLFDESGGIATTRVSVDSLGVEADNVSNWPDISADGRHITFRSWATNLVVGDTNGVEDIFVHDRLALETTRVSVSTTGDEASDGSDGPVISATGRYVAFHGPASNLVLGDTNDKRDVFVRDRDTDEDGIFDEPNAVATVRISVRSDGVEGDGHSFWASISNDGRYIAFLSLATDLVADDTNDFRDVFVHDRDVDDNGVFDEPGGIDTWMVSVSSNGQQGDASVGSVSICGDGSYVAFRGASDLLVPDDDNGTSDIFRHDLLTAETTRVSVSFFGGQSNGYVSWTAMTDDGDTVVFASDATNLVPFDLNAARDVFVRQLAP